MGEEETKITNRIAIIALLSAIVFGTISIYGNFLNFQMMQTLIYCMIKSGAKK